MNTDPHTTPSARRAPAAHYVLAMTFGAVVTLALALGVAASNRDTFWVAAGVTALCAGYPSVSLGINLFVSKHTVVRDLHGEQSVEVLWMRQAATGAFIDVLATTTVAAIAIMITGIAVDARWVLLALISVSVIDAGTRYVVAWRRALR